MPTNSLTRAIWSAQLRVTDPQAYRIIQAVRAARLTYLSVQALDDLRNAARRVDEQRVPGVIVEAGVALGGSAIILAKFKADARPLQLYDVFGMIPSPSADDGPDAHARYADIASGRSSGIGDDRYYGYEDELLAKVEQNLAQFGVDRERSHVELFPGLFENSLRIEGPVALAHIDCDWYQSVMVCLERIAPRLTAGGVVVIDDYRDWSGCKRAVDEYFAARRGEFKFTMRARLHIERRG